MHQPRPYGRFHGDVELASADEVEVESLLRSLTNFKDISSLESLKRVRDLPSGRQAVAIDMGGTLRVLILEKYEVDRYKFDGLAETNIPMLFSGVITRDTVKEEEGVKLKITEQTRRRIAGYKDKSLPKKEIELQRFRIEYGDQFKYFEPEIKGIYTFTQYHKQRPNWYSGAMAQVMQVVGGYGRQDFADLPDDDLERSRMVIPEKRMTRIRQNLINVRLPGYTGFPDKEGKFKYDYKFLKCHGVTFDSSNKPWLIQVDQRGVYAMPLPLVPATTTKDFREYIEDVGDEELELLLDRFGGLPTGESFPEQAQDFEAWRRAGVIIKVCDTSDFYENSPYYLAGGWSFNSKGTEGFNTCWSTDARGLKQGFAYKMSLELGEADNHGMIPLTWVFETDEQQRRADAYLSSIYRQLNSNNPRDLAIKYKIRRHSITEILNLTGQGVDYWDRLEMDPIANHSGNVNRVASGPIYWGLWMYPQSMGRLKFPELTGQGCESFIMVSPDYRGPSVRCDTIVFGCYVDDSLQVIKYFHDDREFYREEVSTFEPHMIVGQWEKTVTTGNSGLMGYFYTSSFDDRQEAPPVSTYTNIVGSDLGYSNPAYHTPPLLYCVGSVSRSRFYKHVTKTRTTEGFSINVAACVPAFTRDCIVYPYTDGTSGRTETESATRGSVADPTSYQMWTYDFIFHYMGQTQEGNKGDPSPKEGEIVYVDSMLENPQADPTGFASSGDWLGLGGGVIDISGMAAQYTSRSAKTHHAGGVVIGGEAPNFESYSKEQRFPGESSGRLSISFTVAGSREVHKNKPNQWYYDFSPVEAGGSLLYFYRDAVSVTIGSAEYASFSEKDAKGNRIKWGHTELADHTRAHHFIGVINE